MEGTTTRTDKKKSIAHERGCWSHKRVRACMCIRVVRTDARTSSLLQLLSTLADIFKLHMPRFLHMQKGPDEVYLNVLS